MLALNYNITFSAADASSESYVAKGSVHTRLNQQFINTRISKSSQGVKTLIEYTPALKKRYPGISDHVDPHNGKEYFYAIEWLVKKVSLFIKGIILTTNMVTGPEGTHKSCGQS